MDREQIIRMAREAGFSERDAMGRTAFLGNSYDIERFAALVAAEKEHQIIDILERLQERSESHNYYAYAIKVIRGEI
jgi:hypothetical protein